MILLIKKVGKKVIRFTLKRFISLIPILFVVSTVVFLIIHLTPGNPASIMLGNEATSNQIEELEESLGLDLPIYEQYFNWIINAVQGDFGTSYFLKQPVMTAIFEHIAPTLNLAILAQIIGLGIAIPFGIMAAKHRGTMIDHSFMGISLLGISVPSFVLGLFFIIIFAVKLEWLPVAGYDPISDGIGNYLKHLIMPAIALGAMQAALIARMTRSSMLDVLKKDFIKVINAKGAKERQVIFKHAFRNALLPILTVVGQSLGGLITGAVVVETIFNIPGLGQLIINSIERRDLPIIQGTVMFSTLIFVVINFVIDLLYGFVDPRVRLGKNKE